MLDNNKGFTHVVAIMSIMTVSKKNRTCFQQKISHRISSQVTNLITCIFVRPLEINNNMISISMLYFPAIILKLVTLNYYFRMYENFHQVKRVRERTVSA